MVCLLKHGNILTFVEFSDIFIVIVPAIELSPKIRYFVTQKQVPQFKKALQLCVE